MSKKECQKTFADLLSESSLAKAMWAVSLCTPGIYRMTATVVWESTLNRVQHVENKSKTIIATRMP